MLTWQGSGGFSIDASVRIGGDDRASIERLIRYCARPPAIGQGNASLHTSLPRVKRLNTVYVSVHVRTPKVGERTQFHTLGLGKNPRKYWVFVNSGIAGRDYKAAALAELTAGFGFPGTWARSIHSSQSGYETLRHVMRTPNAECRPRGYLGTGIHSLAKDHSGCASTVYPNRHFG
jgi:hypothetical protein